MDPGNLTFSIARFDDLSLRDLYDVLHLRDLAFVVGQKITAEPEVDGEDPEAWHVQVREAGRLVATARIFTERDPISVGRIAVLPEYQRGGYGTWMMTRINEWLGDRPAIMHAQAHLEPWYTRCGWQRFGEPFDEADIPHVNMRFPPR